MQENFFVDGSNHFVNNLFRETEKSQQQQRDYSNVIIREEQPWQRKKQKKLLRKLLKKLQKKLLKKLKRSSCFCKAIAFERAVLAVPESILKLSLWAEGSVIRPASYEIP